MSRASRSQLARVLADRFATAKDVPALEHAIAEYLLREKRVGELDSLLRDIAQIRADEGYVEADVVSAFPLTDAAEADAKDLLPPASHGVAAAVLRVLIVQRGHPTTLPTRQLRAIRIRGHFSNR